MANEMTDGNERLALAAIPLFRQLSPLNYPWTIKTERNTERLHHLAKSSVGAVKVLLVWLFTAISWQTIRVAMGQPGRLGVALIAAILGITAITVVVYVSLARRAGTSSKTRLGN